MVLNVRIDLGGPALFLIKEPSGAYRAEIDGRPVPIRRRRRSTLDGDDKLEDWEEAPVAELPDAWVVEPSAASRGVVKKRVGTVVTYEISETTVSTIIRGLVTIRFEEAVVIWDAEIEETVNPYFY